MSKKFIISLYMLFSMVVIEVYSPIYASSSDTEIDFSHFLQAPNTNDLVEDSPQKALRNAYNNLRTTCTPDEFMDKILNFKESIYTPIDYTPNNDQMEFLNEIRSLKTNLQNSGPFFKKQFSDAIEVLGNRIDNARIDQQLFTNEAKCGINHPDFSIEIKSALNEVVGKIFHITQEEGDDDEVSDVGSAILISLDSTSNLPIDLERGKSLNGLMTCAHVIEANEDEHIIGAYFVPNKYIDPRTGFPLNANVTNEESLQDYLHNSNEVYRLSTYYIKIRTGDTPSISGANDILSTRPQYWRNEDIVFVKFSNQSTPTYDHDTKLDFSTVRTDHPKSFSNDEKYYAMGYPGCSHYDPTNFQTYSHKDLIESIGFAPLFVTSSKFQDSNAYPSFNEGRIQHKAPTASGMSGGVLVKIENENVCIIGNIASGEEEDERGCY